MGLKRQITNEKVIQGIEKNLYVLQLFNASLFGMQNEIEKLFDSLMRGYPLVRFYFGK
jgi:hypothetical protein